MIWYDEQKQQMKKNTDLVTNIEGYNIPNNNIIYWDLNPSPTSNNLLVHKSKYKVKGLQEQCQENIQKSINLTTPTKNKQNKPLGVYFSSLHLGPEIVETAYNHLQL